MSQRHPTLGRVLGYLGTTVLDLVAGNVADAREVGGVVIHDPLDDARHPPGALVLGVGVQGAAAVAGLVEQVAASAGCGLIVREPVPDDPRVMEAVARTGMVLLGLVHGAAWTQLASLLHGLLADEQVGGGGAQDTIAGLPAGDLFAVANAVSSLLDAPVTIEDRSSRVLAFSGRQDEADPPRAETILGRQVPERYARMLRERGVFHDLYRTDRPVFIDLSDIGLVPRAAVAVRAGDEILGSVWAAVRRPLTPSREQAFRDVADIVALHMLRLRAGADVRYRLRADLVATALEGGPPAAAAMDQLGLAGRPMVVLAVGLRDSCGAAIPAARREAELENTAGALTVHLSARYARSAVALLGEVAYAIIPVIGAAATGDLAVERTATEFLQRTGTRLPGVIGVGRVAASLDALSRSRADADRVLRVLRAGTGARRVARLIDVHTEVLLLELAALAQADGHVPSGALARLLDYDAEHRTGLIRSLRVWLDEFGDTAAAARAMHVHGNTFRYRLHRIAEVGGVDLGNSEARFALMLELRLLDRERAAARTGGGGEGAP